MSDECEPPLHKFSGRSRTCLCGAVSVPEAKGRTKLQPPGNWQAMRRGLANNAAAREGRAALSAREAEAEADVAPSNKHPWNGLGWMIGGRKPLPRG